MGSFTASHACLPTQNQHIKNPVIQQLSKNLPQSYLINMDIINMSCMETENGKLETQYKKYLQ